MSRTTLALVALCAVPLPASAAPVAGPPALDDHAAAPADGPPAPSQRLQRQVSCDISGLLPGTPIGTIPPDQALLGLSEAGRLNQGDGQTVAVLDTGVQPQPRLPNLAPGGDYVEGGDGLGDCDAHGTFMAGIIAGRPDPVHDLFVGVAPAAKLVSVRVISNKYTLKDPVEKPALGKAAVDTQALARAVVHAANLGATVIVIGTAVCVPADALVDIAPLGAALRYASVDKDALVVSAAGDTDQPQCTANPLADPARPQDPRNWAGATTLSIPSLWQPYVLSVAALTAQGQPSISTLAGPWVSAAAPGQDVVSLSNDPAVGLANVVLDAQGKPAVMHSSGYAAAYVAGVAALVRSRYPALTAHQVANRIVQTAHNAARMPSDLIGAGMIDPLAALTWDVPLGDSQAPRAAVKQLALPAAPAQEPRTPKLVAFAGVGALAVLVAIVAGVAALRRKRMAQ